MSHWDYRVIQRIWDGEIFHEIVEAYYDDAGNLNGYTKEAIAPLSENGIEGLRIELERMMLALEKPVITDELKSDNIGVKQVIIIRKDLKMRRGKEIAQGSHASMAWLTQRALSRSKFTPEEKVWLEGSFTKVCLQVNSEEELIDIYNKAMAAGLTAKLITDAGKTEFDGVPTKTAVGIGPNSSDEIDKITGDLKLY